MSIEAESEQSHLDWSESILKGNQNPRLLRVLQAECGNLSHAFLVNWIPEQAEDLYVVATSLDSVLTIEVPRIDQDQPAFLVEKTSLKAYRRNCSKNMRRRLAVIERLLRAP